jgi:hypothetical protein
VLTRRCLPVMASNDGAQGDECYCSHGEPIPDHEPLEQFEMPAEHVYAPPLFTSDSRSREGDYFAHETKVHRLLRRDNLAA